MNSLVEVLRAVGGHLDDLGTAWALVGGLAVGTRAAPRTTRDVDIAVAVTSDRDAENIVGELRGRGYEVRALVEQDDLARIATVRLLAPGGKPSVTVDLLFCTCGIEREIVAAAERIEIVAGLKIPIARAGHLIAMKLLARDDRGRPQDADDVRALVRHADRAELDRAKEAIAAIERSGAHRGRALQQDLAEALDEHGPSNGEDREG